MYNKKKELEAELQKYNLDINVFLFSLRLILFISIIILSFCIVSSLFVFGNNINLSSTEDLYYNYEQQEFFNSSYENTPINPESPFNYLNMRNKTQETEHYNATYSFENDTDDTFPNSFNDNDGASCNTLVKSSFDNHSKILEQYDGGGTSFCSATVNIIQGLDTVIEFWATKSSIASSTDLSITFWEGVSGIITFDFKDNDLIYLNSTPAYHTIKEDFLIANSFSHFSIILNDTYNTFDCYINNILEGNDLDYRYSTTSGIDSVRLSTDFGDSGYYGYWDAIGISSDINYNIGDNYYPYLLNLEVYEVDTWDFWYEGIGDELDNGDDNPNDWLDIEDGGDDVNYLADSVIQIVNGGGGTTGLQKTNFAKKWVNKLQISFGLCIHDISPTLSNQIKIFIYSYDLTEIIRLYIDEDGNLGYYDGSEHILDNGLIENVWYYFKMDINYDTDICDLEYGDYDYLGIKQNNTFGRFQFSLNSVDKDGLSKIQTVSVADSSGNELWLDYIGVYINQTSISSEFGQFGLDIITDGYYYYNGYYYDNWNFIEYNMIQYNIAGEQIGVYMEVADYISHGAPEYEFDQVVGTKDYNGNIQYANVGDFIYDNYYQQRYIIGGVIWFPFYKNFTFDYLNIYGIRLIDNNTKWTLDFNSENLDTDDSRFYVSNNKFYYSMTTDDDDLEYIEITFKLYDDYWQNGNSQQTMNRSIRWGGVKYTPYLYANFKVNYAYSDFNMYEIKTNTIYTNYLIPQDKIIISFGLLISDNNNNINTTITGYLYSLILYYNPGASMDILISNYINIIPAVMIISTISITIWSLTKKKVGNMLVAPSIALTAYLSYISGFMPLWLLFVVLVSAGTLIASKWKDLFMIFTSFMTMILGFLSYAGVIDLWTFYGSFLIMIGYLVFTGIGEVKGVRE